MLTRLVVVLKFINFRFALFTPSRRISKTRKASDLLSDLETTFKCLRAKGMKLNLEKCVFGVPQGMLLGFIVSERRIEANPEKIVAITNMGPIKDLKGV
jgi:hypothetical protein